MKKIDCTRDGSKVDPYERETGVSGKSAFFPRLATGFGGVEFSDNLPNQTSYLTVIALNKGTKFRLEDVCESKCPCGDCYDCPLQCLSIL